jgi:histidine triad (HIT) family protein
VPRVKKDGLKGFFWPRTKYESGEQLAEAGERIRSAVAKAG